MAEPQTIHPTKLSEIAEKGHPILDVRTEMEHVTLNLDRPHDLVTLDKLDPEDYMKRRGLDSETPVYILCRSGKRATAAAEKFIAAGYANAYVVEGGILGCEAAGEPVNKQGGGSTAAGGNAKIIPIEQQVRTAAGALVLLGTALGFAHPGFLAIPLFVGAGLVYSGITGNCGMALLLAKAPWNKVEGGASCELKMDVPKKDDAGTHGGCA